MTAAQLVAQVRDGGKGGTTRCPAHDDHSPSLSVGRGRDGGVVVKCHAGCTVEAVVAALDLDMLDLAPPGGEDWTPAGPAVATYLYVDEAGETLYGVARTAEKEFRQFRPDDTSKSGRRWSVKGVRGVPYRLPQILAAVAAGQTIYVVEGEKDVHAVEKAGAVATCNAGGAGKWDPSVAKYLAGADVVVVADRDEPGYRHAFDVAQSLTSTARSVRTVEAVEGKDVADHLAAGHGLDELTSVDPSAFELTAIDGPGKERPEGETRTPSPSTSPPAGKDERPSQATQLVALAVARFTLGCSSDGEPFAVPKDGPRIAQVLRGAGSLRAEIARLYAGEHDKVPTASALADSMNVLEGHALHRERRPVHLRLASLDGGVVLDLGGASGRVVHVTAEGWRIIDESPILFRRTALTGALPEPQRGGSLDALRGLLNVTDEAWPLVVAWLVAALIPGIPHPIVLLTGEQGAGKSSAARALARLVDPSPAGERSVPRDVEGWAVAAAGSWMVPLDNVSHIAPWLSDALCRAVTGDGLVRRKLYTDSDLSVMAFRRVILLTAIDPGALRGDLADRLLAVELERIRDADRREDAEVTRAYNEAHPQLLGALLDLLSGVLDTLPDVHLDRMPRMADFSRIVAAVDRALGTDALATYLGQRESLAADVVDADPIAAAVVALVHTQGTWEGTAGDLLGAIDEPDHLPKIWPTSGQAMAAAMKRAAPGLRSVGVEVEYGDRSATSRARVWRFAVDNHSERSPEHAKQQSGQSGQSAGSQPRMTARPITAGQSTFAGSPGSPGSPIPYVLVGREEGEGSGEADRESAYKGARTARTARNPISPAETSGQSSGQSGQSNPPPASPKLMPDEAPCVVCGAPCRFEINGQRRHTRTCREAS